MGLLILIVLMFALMWVLVILPQRRRQSQHNAMVRGLAPGQEILTAGGLYGDVTEVGEDEVAIEIAPGIVVRVAMRAVAAVIPPDAYEDEDEADVEDVEAAEPAPAEEVETTRTGQAVETDRR